MGGIDYRTSGKSRANFCDEQRVCLGHVGSTEEAPPEVTASRAFQRAAQASAIYMRCELR